MTVFLQAWLKNTVLDLINNVLQEDNIGSNIENLIRNLPQKRNNRVQIAQFEKCPTESNPNEKCVSFVVDECNYITAIFSPVALNKFKSKYPNITVTSLRGSYIILNTYNFNYDRDTRQIYIQVDEFEFISREESFYNDMQFINDVPSIKHFIEILNLKIKEENKEDVYHYGWKDINKLSDEDCYVSLEDRSILDNLPGWSDSDSGLLSSELTNKIDNTINGNDDLFNSQSIFDIVDFNDDDLFRDQKEDSKSKEKENQKSEKRYRDSISDDPNSSGNEMAIEEDNNKKRIKLNNDEIDSQNMFFSQPIEIFHDSQDINMDEDSILSTSTDENLRTSKFAPAGNYSNNSHGELSENTESEPDKDNNFSYIEDRFSNKKSFNTDKIIEKANFYSQFNNSMEDKSQFNNSMEDKSDEILFESQNFDDLESQNSNNSYSWDSMNHFNLLNELEYEQNSPDNNDDPKNYNNNMISDNFQYISENSAINNSTNRTEIPLNSNSNIKKNVNNNIPIDLNNNNDSNNNNKDNNTISNANNEDNEEEEMNLLLLKNKLNNLKQNKLNENSRNSNNSNNETDIKENKNLSKKNLQGINTDSINKIIDKLETIVKSDIPKLVEINKLTENKNTLNRDKKVESMLLNLEKLLAISNSKISNKKNSKKSKSSIKLFEEVESMIEDLEWNLSNNDNALKPFDTIESLKKSLKILKEEICSKEKPKKKKRKSKKNNQNDNNDFFEENNNKGKTKKKVSTEKLTNLKKNSIDHIENIDKKSEGKKENDSNKKDNNLLKILDNKQFLEEKEINELENKINESMDENKINQSKEETNISITNTMSFNKKFEQIEEILIKISDSQSSNKEKKDKLINKENSIESNNLKLPEISKKDKEKNVENSMVHSNNESSINNELLNEEEKSICNDSSIKEENYIKSYINNERSKMNLKRKLINNTNNNDDNLVNNENGINKKIRHSPRRIRSINEKEKENQKNVTNSPKHSLNSKKSHSDNNDAISSIKLKNYNDDKIQEEKSSFLLYKKRMQEKRKRSNESPQKNIEYDINVYNDNDIDNVDNKDEIISVSIGNKQSKEEKNKKCGNNDNGKLEESKEEIKVNMNKLKQKANIDSIDNSNDSKNDFKDNKNEIGNNDTKTSILKPSLQLDVRNIEIKTKDDNIDNEEVIDISQSNITNNDRSKTPSPLRISIDKITPINSVNVTPLKPTSILKSKNSESSSKKKVSFNEIIDVKEIPRLPTVTKKVPKERSPKKQSNSLLKFFASLSPPKQNKISFGSSSDLLQYISSTSPLSNRKFKNNKSFSPLFNYRKNNLFTNDKSLKTNSIINSTITTNSISTSNNIINNKNNNNNHNNSNEIGSLNGLNEMKNHERSISTLNKLFSSPFINKQNDVKYNNPKIKNNQRSIISSLNLNNNLSQNENLFNLPKNEKHIFDSNDNESISTSSSPIEDDMKVQQNTKINSNSTEKQQFTEIKSNSKVMEKIFLNDDHEIVETKEKNYEDFKMLKNIINKEHNKELNQYSLLRNSSNLKVKNESIDMSNKNNNSSQPNTNINKKTNAENKNNNNINIENEIKKTNIVFGSLPALVNSEVNDNNSINKTTVLRLNDEDNTKNMKNINLSKLNNAEIIDTGNLAKECEKNIVNSNNKKSNNIIEKKLANTIKEININNKDKLNSELYNKKIKDEKENSILNNDNKKKENNTFDSKNANNDNEKENVNNNNTNSQMKDIFNDDIDNSKQKICNSYEYENINISNDEYINQLIGSQDYVLFDSDDESKDKSQDQDQNKNQRHSHSQNEKEDINKIDNFESKNNLEECENIEFEFLTQDDKNCNIFIEDSMDNSQELFIEESEEEEESNEEKLKGKDSLEKIKNVINENDFNEVNTQDTAKTDKTMGNTSIESKVITIDSVENEIGSNKETNEIKSNIIRNVETLTDNDQPIKTKYNINENEQDKLNNINELDVNKNAIIESNINEYSKESNINNSIELLSEDETIINDNKCQNDSRNSELEMPYKVEVEISELDMLSENEINNKNSDILNNKQTKNDRIEMLDDRNILQSNNEHFTNKDKNMEDFNNGLKYIQKRITDNMYYQSLKSFYDTFTPSQEKIKFFEVNNDCLINDLKENDNSNSCICQKCLLCLPKSNFDRINLENTFEIDYTNWKFY